MKAKQAAINWNEIASVYDTAAFTFEPFAQLLASGCNIRAEDRVLDVGCGTGISTLAVLSRLKLVKPDEFSKAKLIGVDVSTEMIKIAKKKVNEENLNIIHFLISSAEQLAFRDKSFDKVICNFGPHLFANQIKGIREMARVLKGGGRLGFTVPGEKHIQEFVDALISVLRVENLLEVFMEKGMLRMTHQRVSKMIISAGLLKAEIKEKKLQFQINNAEKYAEILKTRGAKGRMLKRLPENRRSDIWQKTLAKIDTKFPSGLNLTCHCYLVFWNKP